VSDPAAAPLPEPIPPERARAIDFSWLPPEAAIPHPEPFLAELVVAEGHLSELIPHANNVEYLRWLDRAAELHAESVGQDRTRLAAEGRAWFVARHELDYRSESFRDERLVIATWVRSARKSLYWRDYRILRPADRTVVGLARTLWVHVDLGSRRPLAPPPGTLEAFRPLGSHGDQP